MQCKIENKEEIQELIRAEKMYDLIIVGAGPAGLSAAIYMARAKYKVLVLEKESYGGQITITAEVVNYPGIPSTSGKELTEGMRKQAERFGAEFKLAKVEKMELSGCVKILHTDSETYHALAVVLAVGANPRMIGFEGEEKFKGRGVAYCATCDGEFFSGMNVFVIGGGFAAVQESMFLTKYAKKVMIMVREADFTCAKTTSDQLKQYPNIEVRFHTEILRVEGDKKMERAVFIQNETKEEWTYEAENEGNFGIFVFAGYAPDTSWLPEEVELDEHKYIPTDPNKQTNIEGVYGAGDVCVKNLRQVVTAVSDGAVSATSAEKYVAQIHDALDLPELEREVDKREVMRQKEDIDNGTMQQKDQCSLDHPEACMQKEGQEKNSDEQNREHNLSESAFFDEETKTKLTEVFSQFERPVTIQFWKDESALAIEMQQFIEEICAFSDRIHWKEGEGETPAYLPSMELLDAEEKQTGIAFHGVPGGHEINSFVVALFNVAGPGMQIEESVKKKIADIKEHKKIKILVSLTCTMCPETVMSAQKIAAMSDFVTAEMFDITYYPKLQQEYQVMSVPCMIINDTDVHFGNKKIDEVASYLV